MINPKNKSLLTALVILSSVLIITSVTPGFKGFSKASEDRKETRDSRLTIQSYKLPDSVTFAGEKMPLENFDTRESLDREILTSAYRHSSTILIIKRANRYLPIIEKILKENNIPDDFKYLAAAESEYSNMVSRQVQQVSGKSCRQQAGRKEWRSMLLWTNVIILKDPLSLPVNIFRNLMKNMETGQWRPLHIMGVEAL